MHVKFPEVITVKDMENLRSPQQFAEFLDMASTKKIMEKAGKQHHHQLCYLCTNIFIVKTYLKAEKKTKEEEDDEEISFLKMGDLTLEVVEATDFKKIEMSTKIRWVIDMLAQHKECSVLIFSSWYALVDKMIFSVLM